MESLVHYKQLLLRNHSTSIGEGGSQVLVKECLQLLAQLESIDPQRRRRYQQLGEYRLLSCFGFRAHYFFQLSQRGEAINNLRTICYCYEGVTLVQFGRAHCISLEICLYR